MLETILNNLDTTDLWRIMGNIAALEIQARKTENNKQQEFYNYIFHEIEKNIDMRMEADF